MYIIPKTCSLYLLKNGKYIVAGRIFLSGTKLTARPAAGYKPFMLRFMADSMLVGGGKTQLFAKTDPVRWFDALELNCHGSYMRVSFDVGVTAGGPGSGRHPGFGHGEQKKALHELTKRGWVSVPHLNGYSFIHPRHPDESVRTFISPSTGGFKWDHWDHSDRKGSGTDAHTLVSHLHDTRLIHDEVTHEGIFKKAMTYLQTHLENPVVSTLLDPEFIEKAHALAEELPGILSEESVEAGGVGSGCWGPNCGRPVGIVALKNSLGIPRGKMPQIARKYTRNYLHWLKKQGVSWEKEMIAPGDLKPIQRSINTRLVALLPPNVNLPGKFMMVSKDSYILDGHHRWYKALTDDEPLKSVRINLPMKKLLEVTKEYPYVEYRTSASSLRKHGLKAARAAAEKIAATFNEDEPRDKAGKWTSGDEMPGDPHFEVKAPEAWEVQAKRIHEVTIKSDNDPAVKQAEAATLARGDSRRDPGIADATGHYTPEADAENRRIAQSFLNPAAKAPEGTKPMAVFMVGKPGAGKTTLLRSMTGLPAYTDISADDVMKKIPGYEGHLACAYHERACDIARNYLTAAAMADKENVIFDMTDNMERLMRTMSDCKSAGYKVGVMHVDVDDATSAESVYNRFKTEGRYVPVRTALSYGGRPKMAYDIAKKSADQYAEWHRTGNMVTQTDKGGTGMWDWK